MKPIVVVGSINMDLVTRTERIPGPGETLTGNMFQLHSGGKGANQAVAVAKLGHPSVLLGAVGDDVFGRNLLGQLGGWNVDISQVATVATPTGTASIVVDSAAENAIVVTPGANAQVTISYVGSKLEFLRNAGMVLLQLEIPMDTTDYIVDFCSQHSVPVMLDPAPAFALKPSTLTKLQWFTPNQIETHFYANSLNSLSATASKLFEMGIRNVILKRGSEGALIASSNGKEVWMKAYSVEAVDTTAAGDAYNGAFAVGLLRGLSITDSAAFAGAAAAICVTRNGAQPSLPTNDEVEAFLQRVKPEVTTN